jgi:hypothetical protein
MPMRNAVAQSPATTHPGFAIRAATIAVALIALLSLGLANATRSYGSTPVIDYSCANDNSNNGHYVPANRYWEQQFPAQGTTITGGYLLLGANIGDHDHTARIGIYTGADRSGALEEIEVEVAGYSGVSFSFPTPISVSPGQELHIAATGVGDFTAYDELAGEVDGCFIGRVEGYSGSSPEVPPSTEPPALPNELPSAPLPEAPQPPHEPSGNPAVAHFSRKGAVAWADNHVNSKYRFGNDCTDFVSMAWTRGGGLGQQGWWYFDEAYPFKPRLNVTYSNTWAAAENFANEMMKRGWITRTAIRDLSVKTIPGAQPGDVILWHDEEGSSTFWSHVALVAGNAAHGLTLIDQHSESRYHTTWNKVWREAKTQKKHILRAQLLHVQTG